MWLARKGIKKPVGVRQDRKNREAGLDVSPKGVQELKPTLKAQLSSETSSRTKSQAASPCKALSWIHNELT